MKLAKKERFQLDSNINYYLKEPFKKLSLEPNPITMEQLLTYILGVASHNPRSRYKP